jgi:NADPH-dependent curcumin reductase CurA
MRRLTVRGFICTDHIGTHLGEAKAELAKLATEGRLKYEEHIVEGLERYPETVRMLMSGANTGKLILKI